MNECLFDTDIISFYLKGNENILKKIEEYLYNSNFIRLTLSEITYFEILAGLEYRNASKQAIIFESFIQKCRILKLSFPSLKISAKVYAKLRNKGIIIGTPDLLIAGIAIENDLTLVTNNVRHFKDIEGLKYSNWNK